MNPFKVLLRQSVTFYRIVGEENCTHWDYIHTSGATRFSSKELQILDLKWGFQKKQKKQKKHDVLLETRFLDWNTIFRLETKCLD